MSDDNEKIILEQTELPESKKFLSKTRSSSLKYPPLMSTSRSKRKIPFGISTIKLNHKNIVNAGLHSLHHSSKPTSFDKQKHSNDNLKISRIMAISPKAIDNITKDKDSNSQKRHYMRNQISDLQTKIHANKPSICSSSSILRNSITCKEKNKLIIAPRKRIYKNRIPIRPPWVSSYGNPTTNNHTIIKPIKRTLLPLNDPCQILQLYTQFKPYDCICTPLPPCLDFMKNDKI